jgi:UDP-2,3-diacylglucosamine hydrolase
VHDVHGTPTLIMHGDQLCTDDVGYQRFRAWWQDPAHRRRFLALPMFARRGIGATLRAGSRRAMGDKPEVIMDVNAGAVASTMRERGVTRLIHGHTHRPARHTLDIDGRVCERQVLADWYRKASYLEVSETGMDARD